ncbi:MAG: Spo0E like sporulation regulatory protein [Anaerosporomusa subterranea]|jgi:hypothetical protein|uniref:aspartyl-phosphate phosphatase Spo0E family protein n=1 Tax=Anaerosporomusa subterranea TaxID=1794912 RepID=UPI0009EE3BF6|nr:aspartyl-phosphate phosphatase Spo0E family protein [Anaerosporomusa subterranea]MDF2501563.1 Spo0E like sporulation regulatory protein [Anaerosporomusa subterranea]
MSEIRALLCKVEELREQLHATIKGRALTDPKVLVMSQQLDQALNEYRCVNKAVKNDKR